MARTRHQDAETCLHRLLDRHETAQSDRAISEMVHQAFPQVDAEDRFRSYVKAAEARGAVKLQMGRGDLAHLMEKVTLLDAGRLYEFLRRTPRSTRIDEAGADLSRVIDGFAPAQRAVAELVLPRMRAAWAAGQGFMKLRSDDLMSAAEFLKAWTEVVCREPSDLRDLRTFSRQACGDSKMIERHLSRIVASAREAGLVGPDSSDEEAISQLALEKFPHLVQMAGDLPELRAAFDKHRHVGIHPDMIPEFEVQRLSAIITIENYASFNRFVREALGAGQVAIYTGGWPGRSEAAMLRHLGPHADRVLHWGDIDMAGAGIADAVWRIIERPLSLHQMDTETAMRHGKKRQDRMLSMAPQSPAFALATWLASPDAHIVEQEELDPAAV